MRFLVIGGAGYVGSHFVFEALRQGHDCMVYDNLCRGHRDAVPPQAEFIHGDLLDTTLLSQTIKKFKPDTVFHYAAFALVGESVSAPELYYGNNIEGTRSLIQAIQLANSKGDKKPDIVFSSTCAIFGSPDLLPVSEDITKNPESPYGFTKLACERLLEDSCRAYGINAMALRYFNAAGADYSGLIGEKHDPETHLLPNVLKSLALNKKLKLFGKDYPTKDGTCIRDYIHVTDLAISHISAARFLGSTEKGTFETVNLGTGNGFSNLEVMLRASETVGKTLQYDVDPRRPGDAVALYADNKKAKELLGFVPEHSTLDNIVKTAWGFVEGGEKLRASELKI